MTDPRFEKLAKLLINYSVELKKGDHILIDVSDVPEAFTIELIRAAARMSSIVKASGTSLTSIRMWSPFLSSTE